MGEKVSIRGDKLKRKILTTVEVLLLIGFPLLASWWMSEKARRQDARDDVLVAEYECDPTTNCVADFNGDGIPERLEMTPTDLIVLSDGSELFRLPYDHTDNTLRTHTAVLNEAGKSHLLVYDGASHSPALKSAFAWSGEKMVQTTPTRQEQEILAAMAAHDDTGGWNERAFRDLYEVASLVIYYLLLAIIAGAIAYSRYRKRIVVNPLSCKLLASHLR